MRGGIARLSYARTLVARLAHLLCKLELVAKTSQYGLAVPDALQIELRKEDTNESALTRYIFAIRAFMWTSPSLTGGSLGVSRSLTWEI